MQTLLIVFLLSMTATATELSGPSAPSDFYLSSKDKLLIIEKRLGKLQGDLDSIGNTKRGRRISDEVLEITDKRKKLEILLGEMKRLRSSEKSVAEIKVRVGLRDLDLELIKVEKDLRR